MANNVTTILSVEGSVDEVNNFIDFVRGDQFDIDFNKVLPLPKELEATTEPVIIMTQEQIDEQWSEWRQANNNDLATKHGPLNLGMTQEQSDNLKKLYRYDNWLDWTNNNWGTKSNAFDFTGWDLIESKEIQTATISYITDNTPPTEFLKFVAKKFSNLIFKTKIVEEGGGLLGFEIFQNETYDFEELDWYSEEGKELRMELGCYDESEEDQFEEDRDDYLTSDERTSSTSNVDDY
jgi:hypothetical protein